MRRVRPLLLAIAAVACGRTWPAHCEDAIERKAPDRAGLCVAAYQLTGDPATGARAARALQSRDGARGLVERLASEVGDLPGGADAWLAAGVARDADDDSAGALQAFQRALAHRDPEDRIGRVRDTVGLMLAHESRFELADATRAAADAYALAQDLGDVETRANLYVNIVALMIDLNNLAAAERMLAEARAFIPATSPRFAVMRALEGNLEQLRKRPLTAAAILREARVLAARDDNAGLQWQIDVNLADADLELGRLDEAAQLIASLRRRRLAEASDRATVAYYEARLAVAQGKLDAAAAALADATSGQPHDEMYGVLAGLRGNALALAGRHREAEQALGESIAIFEQQRVELKTDTFKSWVLAKRRESFEDLVELYLGEGRIEEALQTIQRATARSILDGLLRSEWPTQGLGQDIVLAGERQHAMQALARSLRSTPVAELPPISEVGRRLRGFETITYFQTREVLWAIALMPDGQPISQRIGTAAQVKEVMQGRPDELGALLLPDAIRPPAGRPLFIIPDFAVSDVSFAALRLAGRYLVETNPVGYAPSAGVLAAAPLGAAGTGAFVVGDPTEDLPSARQEAQQIAAKLATKPVLGAAATVRSLFDVAAPRILHVASHTVTTPNGPALRMADGVVDAAGVLDHGTRATTVVLLACSSAAGVGRGTPTRRDQDELGPLAAAFLAAGAQTVVASRWAVDDEVARRFAQLFYDNGGDVHPIEATALAQRALAQTGVPVAQWSTFVVFGGLSTVLNKE